MRGLRGRDGSLQLERLERVELSLLVDPLEVSSQLLPSMKLVSRRVGQLRWMKGSE